MRKSLVTVAAAIVAMATVMYSQESSPKPSSSKQTTDRKQAGTSKAKPAASAPGEKPKISSTAPKVSIKGWKTYCSEEGAYCISYPPDWNVVGDVFEGTGIVMAPPQDEKDKAQWDEVTVSVADIPEVKGKEPPTFDEILSVAMNDLPGKNVQTLQRTELTLAKRPAELIRVQYDDPNTNKTWIEEVVFLDDGDAIYSMALRAVPEDLEKLEPVFRTIVATWRPSEEAPAVPAPPAKKAAPKPGATKVTPQ
jgi:hypothetical protein